MLKPLIIFYGYKQVHNASAQIARTFWEHVPECDFQPTIVCTTGDWTESSRWPLVEIKENRILHIVFGLLRRIGLKDFAMIPDAEYYSWNPFAYRRIKKLLKKEDFDYIHVISSPQSSHLLGLKVKHRTGMKLIVQCNDPWHDTSGRKYRFEWCAQRDLMFERKIAEGADFIIHSNKVITEIWSERYGKLIEGKMQVVPFSFNIFELPVLSESRNRQEKLTISHIGNIYSTRSSMTIFRGIEMLLQNHPEVRDKFVLNFIGSVHQSEVDYVNKNNLSDCVHHLGKVNPAELQSYYLDSDIFLIIDVIIKRNPNYPSKLMMYYYYRKPIIGLTTPNSNLAEELLSSGHSVCYYDEPEAVSDYLYNAITNYDKLLKFNQDFWKKHTVENVRNVYCNIIHNKLSIK